MRAFVILLLIGIALLGSCQTTPNTPKLEEYPGGFSYDGATNQGAVSLIEKMLFRFGAKSSLGTPIDATVRSLRHALEFDTGARQIEITAELDGAFWQVTFTNERNGSFSVDVSSSSSGFRFSRFSSQSVAPGAEMPLRFLTVDVGGSEFGVYCLRGLPRTQASSTEQLAPQVGLKDQKFLVVDQQQRAILTCERLPDSAGMKPYEGNWARVRFPAADRLSDHEFRTLVSVLVLWAQCASLGTSAMDLLGNDWSAERMMQTFRLEEFTVVP